ncbi:MAG: 23S rRNA (pseudouridine(1915)-N(3))-methyltransferase RlmH [Lachnospiraceae bacterium]|nr:23S rRNA (pseudouridine(1915)-N(3))-methyltransferase RlmH [Lachnospiraceae bacterium]
MKITILCVGKLKEAFFREASAEYEKRLKGYAELTIREFPDEKAPESLSAVELSQVLKKEGERMDRVLKDLKGYVIALCIDGERPDSVAFSRHLERLTVEGVSHLIFLIGGSNGLWEELIRSSDYRLSFSPMTLPHQLCRIVLLEQIYRAFKILRKEPYHK